MARLRNKYIYVWIQVGDREDNDGVTEFVAAYLNRKTARTAMSSASRDYGWRDELVAVPLIQVEGG